MSGILGVGGGGGGGGTAPTLRFSVQGMAVTTTIDNITLLQDIGLSLNILNAAGASFEVSCYVANSSGTPFCVTKDVLDADGNTHTVI